MPSAEATSQSAASELPSLCPSVVVRCLPGTVCVAEQEYFNMQTKPNIETGLTGPELDDGSEEPPIINNS